MISAVFIFACLWLGLLLDERFSLSRGDTLVRLAAAIVLGFFWGTWLVYLAAWCFGFSAGTVAGVSGALLVLDWRLGKTAGPGFRPAALLSFDRSFWAIGAVPVLVILSFFIVEVWITPEGAILYYGNFTDMAFHMGTVSSFLEQTAFPPLNPQFATAKLSYHFMADFLSAILCRGGIPLFYGLKFPMVLLAFSLGTLTCRLFYVVAGRGITALAAIVLFFFGHIGCFNLVFGLIGYPVGNVPLTLHSWASVEEHLAFPYFNFLNVLVDFFQPQLAFLFGFPLAMLLLLVLFRKFARGEASNGATYFVAASIALLPLFHMHSFLVLGPLMGLFALCEPRAGRAGAGGGGGWAERPAIRIGFILVAGLAVVLQLSFILSQKKVPGFSGFDVSTVFAQLRDIPDFLHLHRLWYWVRAGGAPFVFGLIGFFLAPTFRLRAAAADRRANLALLAFFAVTSGYFLLINVYRFTPNWGDSNKFFLYWDLMLCLYTGRLLARCWDRRWWGRSLAVAVLFFGAVAPFGVEWNLRYRRGPSTLFTACDQQVATWIRTETPPDAVFLTANSYTHYVTALAGRRVVNGSYTRETGYADDAIEAAVKKAYRESNPGLLDTVHVDYVVVGPDERNKYHISQPTLERRHQLVFEQNCQGLRYSIYRVQPVSSDDLARERAAVAGRNFVWLSELDPASVQQFGNNLQYDQNFDQAPITLNGQSYAYGLGTHAPSRITFELGGDYSLFQSDIGVDDLQKGGPSSVIFRVEVDGKKAYESYILRGGAPRESVRVDLTGANTLTLIVDDAGDGNHDDHADWAGARLIRRVP